MEIWSSGHFTYVPGVACNVTMLLATAPHIKHLEACWSITTHRDMQQRSDAILGGGYLDYLCCYCVHAKALTPSVSIATAVLQGGC